MILDNWYGKRTVQALITIYAVITISFALVKSLPGGPAAYLKAKLALSGANIAQAMRLVDKYISFRPDQPLWRQYIDYVWSILTGDLGQSIYYSKPVSEMLANLLPWTIFYASLAMLITYGLAIIGGALLAYYEGSKLDSISSTVLISLNSIPYYAAGLVLLFIFGYQLHLFPTGGKIPPSVTSGLNLSFITGALYYAALPIISIVVTATGGLALAMRGNAIGILGEDYLRVAQLRGLSPGRIALRYVGHNAVLPLYTRMLIDLGYIFGGSIVLEMIFRYPAAGYYMYRAINTRDVPLMMGFFITITMAVVVGIYAADLTYGKLDPRAKTGDSREVY